MLKLIKSSSNFKSVIFVYALAPMVNWSDVTEHARGMVTIAELGRMYVLGSCLPHEDLIFVSLCFEMNSKLEFVISWTTVVAHTTQFLSLILHPRGGRI